MAESGLELLDPPSRILHLGDERLEIRPLVLGLLARIERLLAPVLATLPPFSTVPDEEQLLVLVKRLLELHGGLLPQALALAINRELKWTALRTLEQFTAIVVAALAANQDLFHLAEPPLKGMKHANGGAWCFDDTVALLCSHGHSLEAQRGYTLAQFRALATAAARKERRALRDQALAMRAASQYDKDGFSRFLRTCERG